MTRSTVGEGLAWIRSHFFYLEIVILALVIIVVKEYYAVASAWHPSHHVAFIEDVRVNDY